MGLDNFGYMGRNDGRAVDDRVPEKLRLFPVSFRDPEGGEAKGRLAGSHSVQGVNAVLHLSSQGQEPSNQHFSPAHDLVIYFDAVAVGFQVNIVTYPEWRHYKPHFCCKRASKHHDSL